jgi:hypothetical protein
MVVLEASGDGNCGGEKMTVNSQIFNKGRRRNGVVFNYLFDVK